jgi:ferrous iron transport protein B
MPQFPSTSSSLNVALVGNPNTGKSTLFNALTGMQARVGNFPGCTVEKKSGRLQSGSRVIEIIDLPGTYSLSPRTLDEMVSVDVLLGRQAGIGKIDAVVCIVDASNLERNLYLVSQVLDLELPTILVLNMWDVAQARNTSIEVEGLRQRLKIPVVICEAHRKMGVDNVRKAIEQCDTQPPPQKTTPLPAKFYEECSHFESVFMEVAPKIATSFMTKRLVLDVGGHIEQLVSKEAGSKIDKPLRDVRARLKDAGCKVPSIEAKSRYAWARLILDGLVTSPTSRVTTWTDRIDKVLTHRFVGLFVFVALMFVVFQAIYSGAGPFMDLIATGQGYLTEKIVSVMAPGPLRSLLTDGIVAGVGGVIIFVPQIAMLFFFIALLEDCGYMSRAAFVMDKLMTRIGLSGKSFMPLMSSFACAIPGIMATRVIENRRDRMVTMLVAPLMSCSARLPVYLLLTTAFVPDLQYKVLPDLGINIGLQGIVLFVMTAFGAVVAIPVAWLLKKTFFKGETPPFVMELPSYKFPSFRIVFGRVYDRSKAFVFRAGTLIMVCTILVWAAAYFPADQTERHSLENTIEQNEARVELLAAPKDAAKKQAIEAKLAKLNEQRNRLSTELMENSFLGRVGHAIEPAVRPLGWDWKIGVGVLASFPAREVIISTLGTIYSLGGDVDEESSNLRRQLIEAKHADGKTNVYNIVVAFSIMVFFALCAQCASTLVILKRETNSWRWPIFSFVYMTTLAYVGALVTYQVGMLVLS